MVDLCLSNSPFSRSPSPTHLCICKERASSYGTVIKEEKRKPTIVHRVYRFPRFFATRLLSLAGVGSFFEVTTHPMVGVQWCRGRASYRYLMECIEKRQREREKKRLATVLCITITV